MPPDVALRHYGPGRPATFSGGRPRRGGDAGHLDMAECVFSKIALEIISNGSAGNAKSPAELPLPDFQGHFHEYERGADG
jgi:hypothetical protein